MVRVDVAIVGAGMSGLAAARRLHDAGHEVVVLEEQRWVGGRLGTRFVGKALVDHGAQFFTVRNKRFAKWVDDLRDEDLVFEWCRGFGGSDGFPRYAATGGMCELARTLARGLTVHLHANVRSVSADVDGDGWRVAVDGAEAVLASAVILTAPVPQSLARLAAGGVALGHDEAEGLPEIVYDPTLALVTVLDRSPDLPDPGALQRDEGSFSFVSDNQAKGLAEIPALTFHATAAMSNSLWNESDAKATASLLSAADEFVGDRRVTDMHLTRWRYATPRSVWTGRYCTVADDPGPLVLAGDAFGGPRVEGAWLSGDAAAGIVAKRLGEAAAGA